MKKFGVKSVSRDKSLDNLFFFDLRDDPQYDSNGDYIPPMDFILFKAVDEYEAIHKLQNVAFCESIGLGDWLFEPYRLHQFN